MKSNQYCAEFMKLNLNRDFQEPEAVQIASKDWNEREVNDAF